MQGKKLTSTEVTKRMTELRNLQKLHRHDREQISDLTFALHLQETELQTMVFGKKKRPPTGGTPIASELTTTKQARTKASYRRPLPPGYNHYERAGNTSARLLSVRR